VIADEDGIFRHMWYSERDLKTFGVVAAEQALKRRLSGPAYPAKGEWIDFAGGPGTVEELSFYDVMNGTVPASKLRGKVVVVGATAPTFQDVHPVATSGRFPMSGPELQANAIQTLLRGVPLKDPAGIVSALWIVLWSLIGAVGSLPVQRASGHWLRPALLGAAITFGLLAALIVGLALTFEAGWILPATYAVFGFVASAFIASSLALARTRSDLVRNRFSRFVPEQAVDAVMAMSGQKRLEPAEIEATVMFIDMRGFSTHTEHRSARDTIDTLNQYLTIMSEGLLVHGATVVSYMGDGIMAVFGAPLQQDDHADRALEAARELVGPRLDAFNAWLRERAADWTAVIGVGIHSGPVASGMVGSERRLEYAAVGDTTNTAARLESATKELGVPVLLSDATREHLRRANGLAEVATIAVKGREQQVRVWTLPETAEAEPSAAPCNAPVTKPSAAPCR
jgi:adenylate cyclase